MVFVVVKLNKKRIYININLYGLIFSLIFHCTHAMSNHFNITVMSSAMQRQTYKF